MDSEHNRMKAEVSEVRRRGAERFKNVSKKRLAKCIEKKCKTTMIGAIASFEEVFGVLWGHGNEQLSQEEQYWLEKWEEARTLVLNNGNNQIRAAMDEVDEYTVSWNRHRIDFIIKS